LTIQQQRKSRAMTMMDMGSAAGRSSDQAEKPPRPDRPSIRPPIRQPIRTMVIKEDEEEEECEESEEKSEKNKDVEGEMPFIQPRELNLMCRQDVEGEMPFIQPRELNLML
jgi:hypothetical protein